MLQRGRNLTWLVLQFLSSNAKYPAKYDNNNFGKYREIYVRIRLVSKKNVLVTSNPVKDAMAKELNGRPPDEVLPKETRKGRRKFIGRR
jgi:hypothetical protein